jgi:hypothetical protein
VEVKAGMSDNDLVVSHPVSGLRDGRRVRILSSSEP